MKKNICALFVISCALISAAPFEDYKIKNDALCELLEFFDLPKDHDIVEKTQEHWLRKEGKERWEIDEIGSAQRDFVISWAVENGYVNEKEPIYQLYDKAVILGATTSRMQMRLDYLVKLWNQGVRFKEIVWLTGDRELDSRVDSYTECCKTESQAAHIIWHSSNVPEQMRNLSLVFIAAPMKVVEEAQRRPNTKDTIDLWMKEEVGSCSALFVSNQPFCSYQASVLQANLPKNILFDLVGPEVKDENHLSAATILDSVARCIYEQNQPKIDQ